jgi:hypothetical protein
MSEERRRAKYLIRRIRDFLMKQDWKIHLSEVGEDESVRSRLAVAASSIGVCDYEQETLHVHFRKEILMVVVHEALHALYPNNSEDETLRLEEMVMRHLSSIQAKNLMIAAVRCLD